MPNYTPASTSEKRRRLLLHVPVGAAVALLAPRAPVLAAILAHLFVVYETNQDSHKHDGAYLDLAGAAWGVALGGLAFVVKTEYLVHKNRSAGTKPNLGPRT